MTNELIELAEALEEQASLASLNMSGAKPEELLEWRAAAMLRKMAEQKPDGFLWNNQHKGTPFYFAPVAALDKIGGNNG